MGNLVRGLAALGFVCLLGAGGWFAYKKYNAHELALEEKDRQIARLKAEHEEEIAAKNAEIDRLTLSLKLIKVDSRLAVLTVLDQWTTEKGEMLTKVSFEEVNDGGDRIDTPRTMTIQGDEAFVHGWVAKFDDKYVEEGDPLRGKSIFMFKSLYGREGLDHGHRLDPGGDLPQVYHRGRDMTDLEREIFGNFWQIANDRDRQKQLGLRATHGEGVSMKLEKGAVYEIKLRSSDGTSIIRRPERTKKS